VNQASLAEILLVEDNDLDAEATLIAAHDSKLANTIHRVTDGGEALEYLYKRGRFGKARRPDLILLDLNLPRTDGREVLRIVKGDPELKMIPIVILTTSKQDEDVLDSYLQGANAYVRKPVSPVGFSEAVRKIEHFWMGIVILPPHGNAE
jgi:two-component system, chemotaxis family, response regulator Rcp1